MVVDIFKIVVGGCSIFRGGCREFVGGCRSCLVSVTTIILRYSGVNLTKHNDKVYYANRSEEIGN